MKNVCLAFLLLACGVSAARLADAAKGGAIAKVVGMLKDMLKDSQADWKKDKAAFEKFSKYCEDNTDKKTTAIQDATKSIGLLSNKIEEIQGSSGDLSIQVADLKADMAENKQARDDAEALRTKENKAFEGEKKDLTAAMGQMTEAIKLLADIGADQTASSGADHAKFMGKYKEKSLLSIQSSVKQALSAANFFLEPEAKRTLTAFVQGPFTGSYASQSGQIVGILKSMKDTFKSNLETATLTEAASKKAYLKFKKNKEDEHADMKKSYDEKQGTLGSNDGDLSTKKKQHQQTKKQKGEDEDFLDKLTVQCKDKSDLYQERKRFAANEEVALSKAIAILDNDVMSEKFGAVDATKFLQVASATNESPRTMASALLQKAVTEEHSNRARQIQLLLLAGNPFSVVLKQIDNMIQMATDEQKEDDEQKQWCEDTNKDNDDNLSDKKDDLKTVQKEITKLKEDINDPASGLLFQISEAKDSLKTNLANQGKETKTRREDNLDYQQDVSTMSDCITTVEKAAEVLKEYYDAQDNEQIGFLQTGTKEDPDPPATFEGAYKGQNEQGKKVMGLLADIVKATWKEESAAHDAEASAQHDYEDSMKSLTDSEAGLEETIAKLNKDLAGKEKDLEGKYEEETNTEQEKIAIERYIAKIKPGCTFVLTKYDARKTSRAAEKKALAGAKAKLKGTPAFKTAMQQAKEDGFGKCKATCLKSEANVKCQACLAETSIPGYCAGHKNTPGC